MNRKIVFTQNSIFVAKDSAVIEQIRPYYSYDIFKQLLILDFIQLPPCQKFNEVLQKSFFFFKKKTTRMKKLIFAKILTVIILKITYSKWIHIFQIVFRPVFLLGCVIKTADIPF